MIRLSLFVSLVYWPIGDLHAINLLSRVKIKKPYCQRNSFGISSAVRLSLSVSLLIEIKTLSFASPNCSGFAFIEHLFLFFIDQILLNVVNLYSVLNVNNYNIT